MLFYNHIKQKPRKVTKKMGYMQVFVGKNSFFLTFNKFSYVRVSGNYWQAERMRHPLSSMYA